MLPVGDTLFFLADVSPMGWGLWKSDGTAVGTALVKALQPGSSRHTPTNLVEFVMSHRPGLPGRSPLHLAKAGRTMLFSEGNRLWKSDGTLEGTVVVKQLAPEGTYAMPRDLTVLEGAVYFTASDGIHGRELWKSDGTPEGTALVKDIYPGPGTAFDPSNNQFTGGIPELHAVHGTLYFSANDGVHGRELWKSDGTPEGTVLVRELMPGSSGSGITSSYIIPVNRERGTFVFAASDDTNGMELWISDGTAKGTQLIQDIATGQSSSSPRDFTLSDRKLFFTANDGAHGRELWFIKRAGLHMGPPER